MRVPRPSRGLARRARLQNRRGTIVLAAGSHVHIAPITETEISPDQGENTVLSTPPDAPLDVHQAPADLRDRVALGFVRLVKGAADAFFAQRYGHRAVVLETVAAVPGMVGATLQHLRALRRMQSDRGWIRTLLEEAENERMHLMTFIHIARPTRLERLLVVLAQGFFYNLYFLVYLTSPKTAHRITGYLEEEAVHSYTEYLARVDAGACANVAAPDIAIDYWALPADARLRDVILAVRGDETRHRDTNHAFADTLARSSASGPE